MIRRTLLADNLVFNMGATWPVQLKADYCHRLQDAMSAAIVDGLVAANFPAI